MKIPTVKGKSDADKQRVKNSGLNQRWVSTWEMGGCDLQKAGRWKDVFMDHEATSEA